MNTVNWIGQIIGFGAMGTSMISNAQSKRKRIILFKLITDVLWTVSSAMIGSYPAAVTSGIAITREFVFYNKEKKWARSKLWLVAYALVFVGAAVITWKDVYSILPAIASTLATCAFWVTNVYIMKGLTLCTSVIMFFYNLHYHAIAATLDAALAIGTIIVSLVTMLAFTRRQVRKANKP